MHDDVIEWKHFPRYWPFVRRIHRSPVNSPHKGQWRGALMFFFYMRLNKRLSKQSRGWWFETPSHPFRRHCNGMHYGGAPCTCIRHDQRWRRTCISGFMCMLGENKWEECLGSKPLPQRRTITSETKVLFFSWLTTKWVTSSLLSTNAILSTFWDMYDTLKYCVNLLEKVFMYVQYLMNTMQWTAWIYTIPSIRNGVYYGLLCNMKYHNFAIYCLQQQLAFNITSSIINSIPISTAVLTESPTEPWLRNKSRNSLRYAKPFSNHAIHFSSLSVPGWWGCNPNLYHFQRHIKNRSRDIPLKLLSSKCQTTSLMTSQH